MELDDETREQLGYASAEDHRDRMRPLNSKTDSLGLVNLTRAVSRIAPGDIDGRHKARDREAMSRAYWERKARKAS